MLRAYGFPLTNMTVFKYPRCILIATDDDRPVVVAKMRKARKKWACMSRIIGQEGGECMGNRDIS